MANALQTLIPLFFSLIMVALFLNKVHSQDVTSFTYDSFAVVPTHLTYQGDARVLPGSTVLSIAGTNATGDRIKNSVGRVLYSSPVRLWERSPARQATIETTIRFLIRPSWNGGAEGMTFFIAPVGTAIPDSSDDWNLGIYNADYPFFAVEFDNSVNPSWDPPYRHIGINIQSKTSRSVTRFNAASEEEVTARINYDSNSRTITVVATTATQSATLSYVFDLKTILPEQVQVGISASTGHYISAVGYPEIRSWYFLSSLVADSVNGAADEEAYIRQV